MNGAKEEKGLPESEVFDCLSLWLLLLLRSPALSLGFTIFGKIFAYGTVF